MKSGAATLTGLRTKLKGLADPQKAEFVARYFKTGPGEYGEGDIFLGITVPAQRQIAKKYLNLSLADVEKLLKSKIHEERLTSLMILVEKFKKATPDQQQAIYELYLRNTAQINNWDLIDGTAEYIVGPYLQDNDKSVLTKLARSDSIWERRIAIMATYHYIKQGNADETLRIAEILVNDLHDLIQKAVGWMLREVGKRCSQEIEEAFLKKHYKTMPRTMLRYAIERFEPSRRQAYLSGTI